MPTATENKPAGFLTLKEVTARNVNGDSSVHLAGTVLSAWELDDFIKDKIEEGSVHYRSLYEPLTGDEVLTHRTKATALEGDRYIEGHHVSPPWPDYVGLHPEEIIERLKKANRDEVSQARLYERAGLNRSKIVEYIAPVERPPWVGYDDLAVRDVLAKFDVLSDEAVREAVSYEFNHRKRAAIISYEREGEVEEQVTQGKKGTTGKGEDS